MSTIADLITKYNESRQALADQVAAEFSKMFVSFFDKYPDADRIMFTAYAPYFNDGEPCVYRNYADYDCQLFLVPDEDQDEDEYEDFVYDTFREEGGLSRSYAGYTEDSDWPSKKMYEDFAALVDIITDIPDEILEQSFGDGLFTIDRDGVTVSEYDHD